MKYKSSICCNKEEREKRRERIRDIRVKRKEFKCHDFRFNDLMSSRLNDHFIVPNFFLDTIFYSIEL